MLRYEILFYFFHSEFLDLSADVVHLPKLFGFDEDLVIGWSGV